jgi:hypothetical protein
MDSGQRDFWIEEFLVCEWIVDRGVSGLKSS